MIPLLLAMALSAPTKNYPAQFRGCYDGDTCTFQVQMSLGVSKTEDVRLCDVDTPEMRGETKEAAILARDYVAGLLAAAKSITLLVPQKSTCKDPNRCEKRTFTRLLAWVMVDGVDLGGKVLQSGHGVKAQKSCN